MKTVIAVGHLEAGNVDVKTPAGIFQGQFETNGEALDWVLECAEQGPRLFGEEVEV